MEVTKKWYRTIEDIIQCPVCLKVTEPSVIHCSRGHHTCGYCILNLKQCPLCYNNLLPNRINHLVVNDLTAKLGEIQLSINEDIESATTKSQQDKSVQTDPLITSSVNTQTDETKLLIPAEVYTQTSGGDYSDSPKNSNWRKQIVNKTHSYPCLICIKYLNTYASLEKHLEENHAENLQKFNSPCVTYKRSFDVQCDKLPWECEYVVSVCSRILFFVNILIRSDGCIKSCIRFIDISYPSIAQTFDYYYSIVIHTSSRLMCSGKVEAHREHSKIEDRYNICFPKEKICSIMKLTRCFSFTFQLCEPNKLVK